MSIEILYVNQHSVSQSAHALMYLDRHTVCQLTYSMSIDIHGVYVDQHTVCRSTYYMSIEILYVDRQLQQYYRNKSNYNTNDNNSDKNIIIIRIY